MARAFHLPQGSIETETAELAELIRECDKQGAKNVRVEIRNRMIALCNQIAPVMDINDFGSYPSQLLDRAARIFQSFNPLSQIHIAEGTSLDGEPDTEQAAA